MADSPLYTAVLLWSILLGRCLSGCPDGSVVHGSSCYLFFNMRTTWSEAEFYCGQLKTKLLSIETSDEQLFIGHHLSREGDATFSKDELIWTGGTTMMTDGRWMWEGNAFPLSYTAWATGEPDTHTDQKRCLALVFNNNFQWRATVCDHKHHFICEASAYSDNSGSSGGGVVIG